MSDVTPKPAADPLEPSSPGPVTQAEQAARKADHLKDEERRRLAETASREEDA
jgi:hypothetical protein